MFVDAHRRRVIAVSARKELCYQERRKSERVAFRTKAVVIYTPKYIQLEVAVDVSQFGLVFRNA